jgi:SAM-dependent methyltransferase
MERRDVFRSNRITVTERLIQESGARYVLEIGAGDFSFSRMLGGVRWIRADLAPPCDVRLDLNSDDVHFPFSDRSFDLVVCTEVIEHLLWPQHAISEALRVLRPGGKLVVSVPNIASLSYRVAWMLGRLPSCAASANLPPEMGSTAYRTNSGRMTGGHVVDFTRARLESLLRRVGFAIAETRGTGLIWHRQLLPWWAVPVSLSSNIICVAVRPS